MDSDPKPEVNGVFLNMRDENSILETGDLAIGFKGRTGSDEIIFKKINVSAGKGELVALFGPNGIGKSTLLRNLVRLQLPVSGEIFLFNQNIRSFSRTRLAKKLGYVSTETIHINNLRVHDLVSLGRYPYTGLMGRLGSEDHEKVNQAINMVSIGHLRNKFIHQLSDGERQRAMIARTLAQDTDIIILDEPTAFLDLPNKYEVVHLLQNLARESEKTIIFSTHDLNIAIQEAGKIWLMLEDTIIQGAPEDLILDGSLGKMFEDTSLKFNKSTGEFRIERMPGRSIGLTGPKTEIKWTKNALERMGFAVNTEPGEDITVSVIKEGDKRIWELTIHNRTYSLPGIYELCSFISAQKDL
jgi:iron complex transport system ATP-binding protein